MGKFEIFFKVLQCFRMCKNCCFEKGIKVNSVFKKMTTMTEDIVKPSSLEENTNTGCEGTAAPKNELVSGPRRKVAMLIAYCGEDYHGMAMNRGQRHIKTIEGELITALVKAKVVPENCWDDPNKMAYKIASRTDKGVSTCGQVASMKLKLNEDVVNLINEQLSKDIRVLAVKRVTKGFSAQFYACARTYSYTLPTYAFADHKDMNNSYIITPDKLEQISVIANRYKGTHSYHNFTSGKQMGDMSANRFIIDFYHEQPFLQESVQFMTFKLKGQSFMLHQIRKMIGLMIAIVSGNAKEEYFETAFTEPLVDIPKAPGTGLVLERVHYEGYNKKHGHLHGDVDFSDVEDKIKEFRQARILPYIYRSEVEQSSMMEWLETLSNHDFTGVRAREDWEKQNALRKAKVAECLEKERLERSAATNDIETTATTLSSQIGHNDAECVSTNVPKRAILEEDICAEENVNEPLVKKLKFEDVVS